MATDIFETDAALDSIAAQVLAGAGSVHLRDLDLPTYQIGDDYIHKIFHFDADRRAYPRQIRAAIEPIVEEAEQLGCNHNLVTALYEAVLNGHQHGNKFDPHKSVTIAYKIKDDLIHTAIIDEGGELPLAFIPFVYRHRRGAYQHQFINFYEFIGREFPVDGAGVKTNNGTGTSFMHTYVDAVRYYKSDAAGLVVHLEKSWAQSNS